MALIVETNPDTRAAFLDPTFKKFPGLEQQLIEEFIYCKEHNTTTDTFGSDAVFTFPPYGCMCDMVFKGAFLLPRL